ncbi:MAG: tRNA-dihydrouridine synthase family protein [Candidatus Micrarchaeota archaeon]|nr:tRNA-dihydrouridine synthase family protein [Candidatus Micrarchaeota archaeon]
MARYGNARLEGKFVLGPMAGYSDIAFRLLCRKHGAAMCFTEFANANALVRGGRESWELARTCAEEMPVGIQIFGSDEKVMADACRAIGERVSSGLLFASCIDINFGCPSGSVIRAGAGSALLRHPEKMASIVSACVSASPLPITCKIRAGWSSGKSAPGIARLLEKAGAAGITVHWRTATEGHRRSEGWGVILEVKRAVGIPVIGNGGASCPQKAVRLLSETSCDAVMISTGALGNVRIFETSQALLRGKTLPEPSWRQKLADFKEYLLLSEKFGVLGEKRLRAHAMEFLRGQAGAREARRRLGGAKTVEEIVGLMEEFAPQAI